jgi:RimJ/RimL family protein N-acetyltransferase
VNDLSRVPSLSTPRLRLVPFTLDDASFVLDLVNDPDWLRYIGDRNVRSLDNARAYLRDGPIASYARNGFGLRRVALAGTGEPMGVCGLVRRETLPGPDLGFAFLPRYRGHGYAREAVDAVLSDARERLGLERVLAITSADNLRSIALLQKAGFAFERVDRLAENAPPVRVYFV